MGNYGNRSKDFLWEWWEVLENLEIWGNSMVDHHFFHWNGHRLVHFQKPTNSFFFHCLRIEKDAQDWGWSGMLSWDRTSCLTWQTLKYQELLGWSMLIRHFHDQYHSGCCDYKIQRYYHTPGRLTVAQENQRELPRLLWLKQRLPSWICP